MEDLSVRNCVVKRLSVLIEIQETVRIVYDTGSVGSQKSFKLNSKEK